MKSIINGGVYCTERRILNNGKGGILKKYWPNNSIITIEDVTCEDLYELN